MRAMAGGICKSRKGGEEELYSVLYSASQQCPAPGKASPALHWGHTQPAPAMCITTFVCVRMSGDHGLGCGDFYIFNSDPL